MKSLSVKTKILSLVLLFTCAILATAVNSSLTSKSVAHDLQVVSSQTLSLVKSLEKARQLLLKQTVEFERGFFQVSIAKSMGGYGVEQIKESANNFQTYSSDLKSSLDAVKTSLSSLPSNDLLHTLSEQINTLEAQQVEFLGASTETYNWWLQLKTMQANKARRSADETLMAINSSMEEIISTIDQYNEQVAASQSDKLDQGLYQSMGLAGILIAIGLVSSLMIINGIARPLRNVVKRAEEIASGTLTRRESGSRRSDEIGALENAFDQLVEKLSDIIQDVAHSSNALTKAAHDLNRITDESTQMVGEQRTETGQISNAIHEIQSTAIHVSESTTEASNAAHAAEHAAAESMRIVQSTITTIESLAGEISTSSNTITDLKKNTDEINSILNVILGIAEQTNLLALNAAIEAARAGEQGRGFAVVADEVRHLAQNTQNATQQIETMIQQLQAGTTQAVDAMKASHERSNSAVNQVREEGATLSNISSSISQIRAMNDSISATAEEQAAVTTEVRRNVDTITTIAERTNDSINAISKRSDELASLASQLTGKIAYFKV
ncbi:methyl-accepting chemotaxis protein [Marinomonas fungiae]|uniref:Methyl-accepting chemotaxis sensory transducer with TarH sensor n=1 Tax=Marinomonas fungiae TaxID=1137284 RepID=A0A0K6IJ24_9GAMM|nr:methyl-accepting chemotaxis protein [Marinomonas fungiae]CUB03352.1 methyl-accepting chemotaxis sensory transducer with TarH sensor [Marinomonas fungiae]